MGNVAGIEVVFRLDGAMRDAEAGIRPGFSPEALAEQLGLTGNQHDDRTLMQRLIGDGDPKMGTLRAVARVFAGAQRLVRLTNAYEANSAQEELAVALGQVVTRQVIYADGICPDAAGLVAMSTRSDIIPAAAREAVMAAAGGLTTQQLIDGMLPGAAAREALEAAHLSDGHVIPMSGSGE